MVELIITIFSLLANAGLLSYMFFYKQTKRTKKAEASSAEIENLNKIIDRLQNELIRLDEKQAALEKRLDDKDKLILKLYEDIDDLNQRYQVKKIAVNCAISCEKSNNECPVLLKKAELENAM